MSADMTSKNQIIILMILTLGSFSFGMAEFLTIWLSPTIAADLKTTSSNINDAVSYYAFGVMAGIPLLIPLIKRMSHQRLLTILLFWCFVGNITTSSVQSWEQLQWVRFLSGMPHGMYFGIASMVLIQILPKPKQGFGIGILMSGIGLALLLVVPVSIYLGEYQDWRIIARVVGLLDLLIILLLHDLLNDAPPPPDTQSQQTLANVLKNPFLWWIAAIAITAFCGRMAIFAYAEAILIKMTHFLDKQDLPFIIIASGIGTFIGFILGGILADKSIHKTIIGVLIYYVATITAFHWMTNHAPLVYLGFVLLGSHTLLLPALQLLIIRTSPHSPTFASCFYHGALNIGNAIGPILSGYVILAGFGLMSITWVGSITSIFALIIFLIFQHKSHVYCNHPSSK